MPGAERKNASILLTGAAGFIGSYFLGYLNRAGYSNLVIVDAFNEEEKKANFQTKSFKEIIERDRLFSWLEKKNPAFDIVFHLGARTDTTEFNYAVHQELNLEYSRLIWNYCADQQIPLVYASSAATYGSGEWGYLDDHSILERLKPLNPYGVSKNEFDKWALRQKLQPPAWAGLKFFNVYGPNEYHKARMASMVFHGFNQVMATGKIRLFRSHRRDFRDGEQLRDFIYVKDVAAVMNWMLEKMLNHAWPVEQNGLYNLGTGRARSFIDLVTPIFTTLDKPVQIEFIDIPEDIRDKYQYFTEAKMDKLRSIGYGNSFTPVEQGVKEYVRDYLSPKRYY